MKRTIMTQTQGAALRRHGQEWLRSMRGSVAQASIKKWGRDVPVLGLTVDAASLTPLLRSLRDQGVLEGLLDLGEREGSLLRVGGRVLLRPLTEGDDGPMVDITQVLGAAQGREGSEMGEGDKHGARGPKEGPVRGPTPRVGRRQSDPLPSPERVARSLGTVSTLEPRPPRPGAGRRRSHSVMSQGDILARRRQARARAQGGAGGEERGLGAQGPIKGVVRASSPSTAKGGEDLTDALEAHLEARIRREKEAHDDRVV